MKDIFRAFLLFFNAFTMFVYGVAIACLALWRHEPPTEVQLYREAILILIWYTTLLKADTWN